MSNNLQNQWDDDFDYEDEEETTQPQGNDLLKQLRRAKRADEKRIKEMEAELQSLRSAQREQTVSKVLESEGVNPKIAKYIPADVQEPDAVKAWLADNAEDFGLVRQEQKPPVDWQAMENMDSALDGALAATAYDDQFNALANAQSADELRKLIYGAE
jgi:type I site-specific restriction-modification system R (restriction) subunit